MSDNGLLDWTTASGGWRRPKGVSGPAATAAVAGGVPLLSACGGSDSGSREGTTSGKDAKKILPTYVASDVVKPDLPSKNGSSMGFTTKLDGSALKTSVTKKLGKGGEVTIMSPFWGSPPKGDNAYYTAMNDLIGVDVRWRNQDGNTYDQKLGAVLTKPEQRSGEYLANYVRSEIDKWSKPIQSSGAVPKE